MLKQEMWNDEELSKLCSKPGLVPYKRFTETEIHKIEKLLNLKLSFVADNFDYVFENTEANDNLASRVFVVNKSLPESYTYVQKADIYNQEEKICLTNKQYYLLLKWCDYRLRRWNGVLKYKQYHNKTKECVENYSRKEKFERFKRLSPRDGETC